MPAQNAWFVLAIIALPIALVGTACRTEDRTANGPEKQRVMVSIPPLRYFVERVGGERVAVDVLVGPGQSPHTYEPTPQQIAHLAESVLFIRLGLPFEDAFLKGGADLFHNLKVVDLREGIPLRSLEEPSLEMEGPGEPDHEHHSGEPDPHIWLHPGLVKIQAETICQALGRADPDHRPEYEKNLHGFQADLDRTHAKIAQLLEPARGREFLVFHPDFGYFADAYGLKQVTVETGGKEPTPKQLAKLIEWAKAKRIRAVFLQPQQPAKSAEVLAAAIGAEVVPLDPLSSDYLGNLEDMAQRIHAACGATEE